MKRTKGFRYVKKKKNEDKESKHIREMIQMLKKEHVHRFLKIDKLEITKHAMERATEALECSEDLVLPKVKEMLKRAKRVGEQLAYDGRINVLYVVDQYAIYLSPNLANVVTVRKYNKVTYAPVLAHIREVRRQYKGQKFRREMSRLHLEAWKELEEREQKQRELVLQLDKEVSEQKNKLTQLKRGYNPKSYVVYLEQRMREETDRLVAEGKKLFDIKKEMRHCGKSMTAVYNTY